MRFDTPMGVQRINRPEAEEEREAFFDLGVHRDRTGPVTGNTSFSQPGGTAIAGGMAVEKNSSGFFEPSAKEVEDIPMDTFSHQSCRWHDCCPREHLKFE